MNQGLPKWIFITCTLISLLSFFVGVSLYLSPETFIKDVDFAAMGVRYLANMWAARQISIGGILAFSLLRRSSSMLQVSLLAYFLMNLQDAGIGILKADSGLIAGASIFTALSGFMIFRLRAIETQK